jgi:hypothetical protein
MLEPGQSLLENAYKMLYLFTGDEQVVAHLFDVLGVGIEVCVFDTCMFLDDIKYALKKHQTALPCGVKLGGVRIFASVNVRDEMPRKIEELMPQWGIEPQEALRVWEREYAPWIHFVDPSGILLVSDRLTALKQRDSTDLQTGQLIELVHPHAVFSKDLDLASFGTISRCSAIVTCAYRDKGRREVLVLYLSATWILTLRVSAAVFSSFIAWLCRIDKRIFLLLVVAGVAAWLYTPSRSWLQERFRAVKPRIQAASQRVWSGLQEVMEDYERLKQQADKANAAIAESRRIIGLPTTVRDHVSRILSNAAGPLSVAEISRLMQDKGYVPRGAHHEIYLRRVLRAHPSVFSMDEDKHWYIKRHQYA